MDAAGNAKLVPSYILRAPPPAAQGTMSCMFPCFLRKHAGLGSTLDSVDGGWRSSGGGLVDAGPCSLRTGAGGLP